MPTGPVVFLYLPEKDRDPGLGYPTRAHLFASLPSAGANCAYQVERLRRDRGGGGFRAARARGCRGVSRGPNGGGLSQKRKTPAMKAGVLVSEWWS